MKADILHESLLNAVKEKLPQGANLANALSEILFIGKEAVYRRIRGEVPFTFFEISMISGKLNISIDSIVGVSAPNSALYHIDKIKFVDPAEADYISFNNCIEAFRQVGRDPQSEVGSSCNRVPFAFTMKYDHLCKFRSFHWMYQHCKLEDIRPFHQITIPEKLMKMHKEHTKAQFSAGKTIFIWDSLIFSYMVNDIKYFNSIQYLLDSDLRIIKEELLTMIDELEETATRGRFEETGKKVKIYISNTNFENSYSYVESEKFFFTLVWAFTLNGLASYDTDMFVFLKNMIKAQQRLSTLISESGEKQRIQFFNKQRELINSL